MAVQTILRLSADEAATVRDVFLESREALLEVILEEAADLCIRGASPDEAWDYFAPDFELLDEQLDLLPELELRALTVALTPPAWLPAVLREALCAAFAVADAGELGRRRGASERVRICAQLLGRLEASAHASDGEAMG